MDSSFEIVLRKITSHFELLTSKFQKYYSLKLLTRLCTISNLTREFNSFFIFRATNSMGKFSFSQFRVTNWILVNKKVHFQLLTQ